MKVARPGSGRIGFAGPLRRSVRCPRGRYDRDATPRDQAESTAAINETRIGAAVDLFHGGSFLFLGTHCEEQRTKEKGGNPACRLKIIYKMRIKQLDGLMAFWKVAQHTGFSAAAAELEVSPSALSQAVRQLESRLGVRLLHRTTRSVNLTEAGEAYLARVGPALDEVMKAGEDLNTMQGRPAGVLRINAARVATAMVLQRRLAGFLREHPLVQIELINDEGFVDIVEGGFDAGIRMGESVQKDMVAVPLSGPVAMAVVASPEYLQRIPAPRHPDDLMRHDCIRFRFASTGAIYKWEFEIDRKPVEYGVRGSLTISDTMFGLEAALEGIGLAYTYEQLARPHIRAKRLKRVLTKFTPTFPGFYLYYPSRHDQPTKLKALISYVRHGIV